MNKRIFISAILIIFLIFCLIPVFTTFQFGGDESKTIERAVYFGSEANFSSNASSGPVSVLDVINGLILHFFGHHIGGLRLTTIVFFSVLLISITFFIPKNRPGRFLGILIAWVTLIALPPSLQFGVAAMKNVPLAAITCLSLAVLQMDFGRKKQHFISGILFGVAAQINLSCLVFAPAAFASIYLNQQRNDARDQLRTWTINYMLWLGSSFAMFFFIFIITLKWNSAYLTEGIIHNAFSNLKNIQPVNWITIMNAYWIFPLMLIGGVKCVFLKMGRELIAGIILSLTIILTCILCDCFDYYFLLYLWIAFAILTGSCAASLFSSCVHNHHLPDVSNALLKRNGAWFPTSIASFCIFASGSFSNLQSQLWDLNSSIDASNIELINQMQKYARESHWIYTRFRICAFYADIKIPSELLKQEYTSEDIGYWDDRAIFEKVVKIAPEQLVLERDVELKQPYWQNFVATNYVKMASEHQLVLFIAKKLDPSPAPVGEMLKKLGVATDF